jgi:hypothetical protein
LETLTTREPFGSTVNGLGVEVSIFENEAAFEASPSSLLSEGGADQPPPAHYVERGWRWPPRVGPESFISCGVFGTEGPRKPSARLAGVPAVGSILHGTVYLVGSVADAVEAARSAPPL